MRRRTLLGAGLALPAALAPGTATRAAVAAALPVTRRPVLWYLPLRKPRPGEPWIFLTIADCGAPDGIYPGLLYTLTSHLPIGIDCNRGIRGCQWDPTSAAAEPSTAQLERMFLPGHGNADAEPQAEDESYDWFTQPRDLLLALADADSHPALAACARLVDAAAAETLLAPVIVLCQSTTAQVLSPEVLTRWVSERRARGSVVVLTRDSERGVAQGGAEPPPDCHTVALLDALLGHLVGRAPGRLDWLEFLKPASAGPARASAATAGGPHAVADAIRAAFVQWEALWGPLPSSARITCDVVTGAALAQSDNVRSIASACLPQSSAVSIRPGEAVHPGASVRLLVDGGPFYRP